MGQRATTAPSAVATAPQADSPAAPRSASATSVWSALAKARLSGLVLATTAVGFAVAPWPEAQGFPWARFLWTCLGTGLAAASAGMLNQLMEVRYDARMQRTSRRPLPAGQVRPVTVFVVGVAAAYAGSAILTVQANPLSGALALANILVYVLLYTPLKPRTTLNTLVGAVTGAIPPVIGWTAAVGRVDAGAWALFAILFVWQVPHFLALAWMYRQDYERGGFMMLPSQDADGYVTAQACVLSSLLLVPVGLLATLVGVCGYVYAMTALLLGLGMTWLSWKFMKDRSDASARKLFLASLAYLPLLMAVMVADRGSVAPVRREPAHAVIELPQSAHP